MSPIIALQDLKRRFTLHWDCIRARRSRSPRPFINRCNQFARQGRGAELLETSRVGLDQFPMSEDLESHFRAAWAVEGQNRLGRLLESGASFEGYAEMVRLHLRFEDTSEAQRVANLLTKRFPKTSRAWALLGDSAAGSHARTHMVKDGQLALSSYRKALDLDARSTTARLGLAKLYLEIGATSQAAFHSLLLLEEFPGHKEASALYERVRRMPVERRRERELLFESEANDGAAATEQGRPRNRGYVEEVSRGLRQLSQKDGVHTVALKHRDVNLLARDGDSHQLKSRWEGEVMKLASGLRREGSKFTRRLGLGRLREVELFTDRGRVVAATAGPSVLMMAVDETAQTKTLSQAAQDMLCAWTSSWAEEIEWTR